MSTYKSATPRRTSATWMSSSIRRRCGPTTPSSSPRRPRHIPIIPRAELLGELMRLRFGIAVAGAHGKTTTTSMIALVLERAGLDPTAVIGGRFRAFGSNARLGRGDYMVAEADESDRSFLKLFPTIAVMTNIDREHMEAYGGFDDLLQAFVDFANKVPFYGAVVMCADDPRTVGAPHPLHPPPDHLRPDPRRRRRHRHRRGAEGIRQRLDGRAADGGRRGAGAGDAAASGAGAPFGAERAGRRGRGARARRRLRAHRRGPRRLPGRGAALRASRRRQRASPSSTTMAITRRRSPRSWRRRARRGRPGSSSPFNRTATRGRAISCASSVSRSPAPTRSC